MDKRGVELTAWIKVKRKAHLSRCGSDVLQIASIRSRRICFCLSVRVLHFEKSLPTVEFLQAVMNNLSACKHKRPIMRAI